MEYAYNSDYGSGYIRITEPEYVLMSWKLAYEHVSWIGIANDVDNSSKILNAANGGTDTAKFYKNDDINWKTGVGEQFGCSVYGNLELYKGVILDTNTNNPFFVFSSQHGYLMTNTFQYYAFVAQDYNITLNKNK